MIVFKGLTKSFAMTLRQILMLDPLFKVSKAYSLVLKYQHQHDLSTRKGLAQTEAAVFAAKGAFKDGRKKANNFKCEKCDKPVGAKI